MKRAHDGDDDNEPPTKVQRLLHPDRLSRLSEELLVRVLSFIPVPSLLVCQRYVRPSEESNRTRTNCRAEYRNGSAACLWILSFGRQPTTAHSFSHGHLAYPVLKTLPTLIDYTIPLGCQNGWKTVILSRMGKKQTGNSNIVYGIIGQEVNAPSVRLSSPNDHQIHLFW